MSTYIRFCRSLKWKLLFPLWGFLLCLSSSPAVAQLPVQADLSRLGSSGVDQEVERIEARRAGGKHTRRYKALITEGLSFQAGKTLALAVNRFPAVMEWAPGLTDLPPDWTEYDRLTMAVHASANCTLRFSVVHVNGPLGMTATIPRGKEVPLQLRLEDLPLVAGNEPLYRPMSIRLEVLGGEEGMPELRVSNLQLHPAEPGRDRRVVDRYGQRIRTAWPGKVKRDRDLKRDLQQEMNALSAGPTGRSQYGGWADGPREDATGFFRVMQADEGTWWLIDPEGYRFWSAGITCVNPFSDATRTEGREFLYEALPAPAPGSPRYENGAMNFLLANVLRKYDSLELWRDHTLTRMQSWGHNTIGNWSDPAMMRPGRIPYVRYLGTRTQEAPMATARFADLFDPAWQQWFDDYLVENVAPHRDDPWLLGWFVDNELPWLGMRLLDADSTSALKQEWAQFVRHRLMRLDSAEAIWGRTFTNWLELAALVETDCPDESIAGTLRDAFEAYYAETYFTTVANALKRYDPNHLYLGCRFVRRAPALPIVQAAGRHCDVLTVNCYAWEPEEKQFGEWHARTGRPILIGEHHVTLASDRQLPPPWQAFNATERETYYKNFVKVWASRPYSLGCHYFQLIDQPLTGRPDGENRTIGWLDLTDQPYEDLVRAAREALPNIYEWHSRKSPHPDH
jgi:hypothetical protein